MNSVDGLILFVVALGLVRGAWTGAIKQVLQVIGLILAFFLAWKAGRPVGEMIGGSGAWVAVGFLVVFVAVQILAYIAAKAAEGILGALKLSVVNRVLGAALGVLRSALLLSGMFLALSYVNVPEKQAREASILYRPVASLLPAAWGIAREEIQQRKAPATERESQIQ